MTIRGRHYIDAPLSPPSSETTSPVLEQGSLSDGHSLSHKGSDISQGSWIKERFDLPDDSSDEETAPTSAVSATSSVVTTTDKSDSTEHSSSSSSSTRRDAASPNLKRQLRVVNPDEIPPQKPAPTGPLPAPPSTPSPVLMRGSPEKMRPSTGHKAGKRQSPPKQLEDPSLSDGRSRDLSHSESKVRSRSIPTPKERRPSLGAYDPFLFKTRHDGVTSPTPEPISASSISTKSTMPPTPPASSTVPAYYHVKPSYYLDNPSPRATRPRANTTGTSPLIPANPPSPETYIPSSAPTTRVKFTDPETATLPPAQYSAINSPSTKLPFPRSPPHDGFPFRTISPPPRKNSASEVIRMVSPIPGNTQLSPVSERTSSDSSASSVKGSLVSQFVLQSPPRQEAVPQRPSSSSVKSPHLSMSLLPRVSSPILSIESDQQLTQPPLLRNTKSAPLPEISTSPPFISAAPTARPNLPSRSKERITSMATETTFFTQSSVAVTASTKPTSRSGHSGNPGTKVQLKRRPAAPSLFPPLPPATMGATLGNPPRQLPGPLVSPSAPSPARFRDQEIKAKVEERRRLQAANWI